MNVEHSVVVTDAKQVNARDMAMPGELADLLAELCADLFQSPTTVDAISVLYALQTLVTKFPVAQRIVGRALLTAADDGHFRSSIPTTTAPGRGCLLAERFLYDVDTALATLHLLAALTHDNVLNQKRVVRQVKGVRWIVPDDTVADQAWPSPRVLFVLSLPNTIRARYRAWSSRQRVLTGRRLPTGEPPKRDGVPAPCHCDQCLGAPQNLATWLQHFNDLQRWSNDSDHDGDEKDDGKGGNGGSGSSRGIAPSKSSALAAAVPQPQQRPGPQHPIRAEAFLQVVLGGANYVLHHHRLLPGDMGAQQEPRAESSVVYFFAPNQTGGLSSMANDKGAPIEIDPLYHACAIELDPTIFPPQVESMKLTHQRQTNPPFNENDENDEDDEDNAMVEGTTSLERVVLLEGEIDADYVCCCRQDNRLNHSDQFIDNTRDSLRSEDSREPSSHIDTSGSASRPENETTSSQLLAAWETSPTVSKVQCHLLRLVLAFLEPNASVSIPFLCQFFRLNSLPERSGPIRTSYEPRQSSEQCIARVVAMWSVQSVEIVCRTLRTPGEYVTTVSFRGVLGSPSETDFPDPTKVLCLTDASLQEMLTFVRLCCPHCSDDWSDDRYILLHHRNAPMHPHEDLTEREVEGSPQINAPDPEAQIANVITTKHLACRPQTRSKHPLPGLSRNAVQKLLSLVSTTTGAAASSETMLHHLLAAIHACDARITALAQWKTVPHAQREAARHRCQRCRDLLVQTCKRIKLRAIHEGATSTTASPHRSLATIVRVAVERLVQESKAIEPWELPDPRVGKLNLSRQLWASGCPDPEFFRAQQESTTTNNRKQRRLNQELQKKTLESAAQDSLRRSAPM